MSIKRWSSTKRSLSVVQRCCHGFRLRLRSTDKACKLVSILRLICWHTLFVYSIHKTKCRNASRQRRTTPIIQTNAIRVFKQARTRTKNNYQWKEWKCNGMVEAFKNWDQGRSNKFCKRAPYMDERVWVWCQSAQKITRYDRLDSFSKRCSTPSHGVKVIEKSKSCILLEIIVSHIVFSIHLLTKLSCACFISIQRRCYETQRMLLCDGYANLAL
jgi:hypothetical protein